MKLMLDHGMSNFGVLAYVHVLSWVTGNAVHNLQQLLTGILLTFNYMRFEVLIVMSLKIMVLWLYVVWWVGGEILKKPIYQAT
jgi:hypothetical protein